MRWRDLVPWKSSKSSNVPVERRTSPFLALQNEINRVFDSFFSDIPSLFREEGMTGLFSPKVDVTENDKAIIVKAELPGLSKDDVNIRLEDDALIISGEKKEEIEKDEEGYRYVESQYGRFQRIIPLYTEVDQDNVTANMKNGVLTIELPKLRAGGSSKTISIS